MVRKHVGNLFSVPDFCFLKNSDYLPSLDSSSISEMVCLARYLGGSLAYDYVRYLGYMQAPGSI